MKKITISVIYITWCSVVVVVVVWILGNLLPPFLSISGPPCKGSRSPNLFGKMVIPSRVHYRYCHLAALQDDLASCFFLLFHRLLFLDRYDVWACNETEKTLKGIPSRHKQEHRLKALKAVGNSLYQRQPRAFALLAEPPIQNWRGLSFLAMNRPVWAAAPCPLCRTLAPGGTRVRQWMSSTERGNNGGESIFSGKRVSGKRVSTYEQKRPEPKEAEPLDAVWER